VSKAAATATAAGERLAPQPWMTAPATQAVLAAVMADGAEARFVGGCVRDALLARPVGDVDIATPEPPQRVIALLERAGLKAVPTGLAHGTITAVADGTPFEITTLRRDVETDGRRAVVAFSDDWREDAARRDLTINALFAAPDGRLFDFFGGVADLRAGRIRFVGEAATRIREDVLRLLRFFRFYAWFGKPPPDAEALAACKALAPLLPTLSAERVRAELLKLLSAADPLPALRLMVEGAILAQVLPEAAALDRLAGLVAIGDLVAEARDPVLRLAALLPDEPAALDAIGSRLRLSVAERERVTAALAEPPLCPALDERSCHLRLYRAGARVWRDRVLLDWAAAKAGAVKEPDMPIWQALTELPLRWPPPRFPLSGKDALAAGLKAGPAVGEALRAVEEWWVAHDFEPNAAACRARLRAVAAN
jgi:poly(A) polymerase